MYDNVKIDFEDLRQGYNRIKKTSHKTVKEMLTSLYAKEQTLVKTGDVSKMTTLQIAKAVDYSRSYVTMCLKKEEILYRKRRGVKDDSKHTS